MAFEPISDDIKKGVSIIRAHMYQALIAQRSLEAAIMKTKVRQEHSQLVEKLHLLQQSLEQVNLSASILEPLLSPARKHQRVAACTKAAWKPSGSPASVLGSQNMLSSYRSARRPLGSIGMVRHSVNDALELRPPNSGTRGLDLSQSFEGPLLSRLSVPCKTVFSSEDAEANTPSCECQSSNLGRLHVPIAQSHHSSSQTQTEPNALFSTESQTELAFTADDLEGQLAGAHALANDRFIEICCLQKVYTVTYVFLVCSSAHMHGITVVIVFSEMSTFLHSHPLILLIGACGDDFWDGGPVRPCLNTTRGARQPETSHQGPSVVE